MTKEEWEKKQSEVRRVYDPETGRHRWVAWEFMANHSMLIHPGSIQSLESLEKP